MTGPVTFIPMVAAAYVAGSVNFSILVCRVTGRQDPRHYGSGNPGATNVYRQAGIGWAAAVLLLDMGRAVGVALAANTLLPFWQVPWVGLGLILGNRFPCFHAFRGGKGVANYLGFTAGRAPTMGRSGCLGMGCGPPVVANTVSIILRHGAFSRPAQRLPGGSWQGRGRHRGDRLVHRGLPPSQHPRALGSAGVADTVP